MKKKFDVIILGSGISALTCGVLLSQSGRRVLILEKIKKLGGYMHCFNRFGSRFDTGAHYVGSLDQGQVFRQILEYLGVFDSDLFIELDRQGFDRFCFPDFQVEVPRGQRAFCQRLQEMFPEEATNLTQFFERVRQATQEFPTYHLDAQSDPKILTGLLETSLKTILDQTFRRPELKAVLTAYCSLHGVHPADVPFGLHALVMDSLLDGAFGFRHGGEALVDRFLDRIRANGGEIHAEEAVESLEVHDQEVSVVRTNKGEYRSEWVISSLHPKSTFRLVQGGPSKPAFHRRLGQLQESSSVLGMYMVCDREPDLSPLKNYFLFEKSDDHSLDEVLFFCRANRTGKKDARGYPVLAHSPVDFEEFRPWVDTHWKRRPQAYVDRKKELAATVLKRMDRVLPGFASTVRWMDISTPVTALRYNGSENGSAYGIYHSISNTGVRALGPRTHIRNLLLTGQSCLFPGLLPATISGIRTAGNLLGVKRILNRVREQAAL